LIAGASVDGAWTGYTFLEGSRKSRIRLLRFHRAGQGRHHRVPEASL